MNILQKAIQALNKINRNKFYSDYAKILNNTKLSDWGGIKTSAKDLEPYDIYTLGKIEEIEEKQKQPDWNQNDESAPDFIKNKPEIPAAQVQADWNQNDENAPDFIKNRICSKMQQNLFADEVMITGENTGMFTETFYTEEPLWIPTQQNNSDGLIYLMEGVIIEFRDATWTSEYYKDYQFNVFDDTHSSQVGGASITCSFSNEIQKYSYRINIAGNPAYTGNKRLYVFKETITKTIYDKFIPDTIARTSQLGGVQFKIAGSPATLQASIDGGTTWLTVSAS